MPPVMPGVSQRMPPSFRPSLVAPSVLCQWQPPLLRTALGPIVHFFIFFKKNKNKD